MAGFTPGFHSGSRSEYLAQYLFSGFGTASAIPHQEDHGFDLYCTLAQVKGASAWADKPFTVQVKSGIEAWVFKNRESVDWLMKHPLPLFLCVVDKARLHFQIYQTTPKYYFWTMCQPYPERLELQPDWEAREGKCGHWQPERVVSLSAPILDFALDQLADKGSFCNARKVLDSWLDLEYENLFRMSAQVRQWVAPGFYRTNEPLGGEWTGLCQAEPPTYQIYSDETRPPGIAYQSGHGVTQDEFFNTIVRIRHVLAWVMEQASRLDDWRAAVRTALLLRCFFPREGHNIRPSYVGDFCCELDSFLGQQPKGYVYGFLDELGEQLDSQLCSKLKKAGIANNRPK